MKEYNKFSLLISEYSSDTPWQIRLFPMGGSPGELSEELVTQEKRKKGCRMNCDVVKQRKGWRMSCDVGKAMEGLENELCRR